MSEPFKTKKYLAIAKEPVFVGTGGYRIGRVDNTIVRDPATNLPKIPGSTISGNARYYSWLSYKSGGMILNVACSKGKTTKDENGKDQEACGTCPVCLTYGFINSKEAHSGLAYFSDARILFFPVSTMIGTIWLTSDEVLNEFIESGGDGASIKNLQNDKFLYSESLGNFLPKINGNESNKNGNNENKQILNFGWIMLEAGNSITPENWEIKKNSDNDEIADLSSVLKRMENRLCVVSKNVFHHIVNSNLETRTSVSINPITGAAKSGALFTFEALPRGTVFIMDVTYENPANYMKDEEMEIVIETVEKGFGLFSSLGIGGMGTRGFGKIEIIDNRLDEKEYWEKVKEFIKNLKKKINELEQAIAGESDEERKKKIEKKKAELEKKKQLWLAYVEKVKSQMEEESKNKSEILGILQGIFPSKEEANNGYN